MYIYIIYNLVFIKKKNFISQKKKFLSKNTFFLSKVELGAIFGNFFENSKYD